MLLPFNRRPGKATQERHQRAIQLNRLRSVRRTMPKDATPDERRDWDRYAWVAISQLGRRGLARVIWPWQVQPAEPTPETRVGRGRLDRNPTAIP